MILILQKNEIKGTFWLFELAAVLNSVSSDSTPPATILPTIVIYSVERIRDSSNCWSVYTFYPLELIAIVAFFIPQIDSLSSSRFCVVSIKVHFWGEWTKERLSILFEQRSTDSRSNIILSFWKDNLSEMSLIKRFQQQAASIKSMAVVAHTNNINF